MGNDDGQLSCKEGYFHMDIAIDGSGCDGVGKYFFQDKIQPGSIRIDTAFRKKGGGEGAALLFCLSAMMIKGSAAIVRDTTDIHY